MKLSCPHSDFGYEIVEDSKPLLLTTTVHNEPSKHSLNQPIRSISLKMIQRGGLEESPLQEDSSITCQRQEHTRQSITRQVLWIDQRQQARKFPNPPAKTKHLPRSTHEANSQNSCDEIILMSTSLRQISFGNPVIAAHQSSTTEFLKFNSN